MSIPIEQSNSILSSPLSSVSSGVTGSVAGSLEGSFDAMLNVIGEENSIQKSSNDNNKWASEYSQRVESDEQSLSKESANRKAQNERVTNRDEQSSKILEDRQEKARAGRALQEEIQAQKKLEQERYLAKKESSKQLRERQEARQSELKNKDGSSLRNSRREQNDEIESRFGKKTRIKEDSSEDLKKRVLADEQYFSKESDVDAVQNSALEKSILDSDKFLVPQDGDQTSTRDDFSELKSADILADTEENNPVMTENLTEVLNELLTEDTENLELQVLSQDDLIVANSAEELLQHLIEKSNLFDIQL
ncbi:MAG: hypothetical protein CMK59_11395, partial [Proteobacteria bacterium]|nr:hypothetical protein [Pseudomonadota bacterium]